MERRAVFVTIPPLLSEIISDVACKDGAVKLIADFSDRATLAAQLPALAPDLVVIGLRAGESDDIGTLVLKLVPAAKVLVLSNDVRRAYLHAAPMHRLVLHDFSLANLLTIVDDASSTLLG
jgi:DNA-binding NarL/FixJ family response regulator